MNMFDRGIPLNEDDCIEFDNKIAIRLANLKSAIVDVNKTINDRYWEQKLKFSDRKSVSDSSGYYSQKFFEEGVPCEILKSNSSGWQKGKIIVRVSVEFYPDELEVIEEPPSPLDDIRQSTI